MGMPERERARPPLVALCRTDSILESSSPRSRLNNPMAVLSFFLNCARNRVCTVLINACGSEGVCSGLGNPSTSQLISGPLCLWFNGCIHFFNPAKMSPSVPRSSGG